MENFNYVKISVTFICFYLRTYNMLEYILPFTWPQVIQDVLPGEKAVK